VLARLVPSGSTALPVRAATAFLGAPYVLLLLVRGRRAA